MMTVWWWGVKNMLNPSSLFCHSHCFAHCKLERSGGKYREPHIALASGKRGTYFVLRPTTPKCNIVECSQIGSRVYVYKLGFTEKRDVGAWFTGFDIIQIECEHYVLLMLPRRKDDFLFGSSIFFFFGAKCCRVQQKCGLPLEDG